MANQIERKEEALKRLNMLKANGMKFAKEPIEAFKRGSVGIFENQGSVFKSTYYDLYLNKSQKEYQEMISLKENFEAKYNCTVYLMQISHCEWGKNLSMFYVSDTENEWEMDRNDLNDGYPLVYVANVDDSTCSEFGTIGIKYDAMCGGIYRTA